MTKRAAAERMALMIRRLAEKTVAPVELCLDHGVNLESKINLATDLQNASRDGTIEAYRDGGDYVRMIQTAELRCKERLMHWMELSGSCGQAGKIRLPYTFSRLQGDAKNSAVGE